MGTAVPFAVVVGSRTSRKAHGQHKALTVATMDREMRLNLTAPTIAAVLGRNPKEKCLLESDHTNAWCDVD